nr:MAG TPA: hypothetical protein [Caudoviricetes sp.]
MYPALSTHTTRKFCEIGHRPCGLTHDARESMIESSAGRTGHPAGDREDKDNDHHR